MTIYLVVLKKLITDKLGSLSRNLKNEMTGLKTWFHTNNLSYDQKEIVDNLATLIANYTGTNDGVPLDDKATCAAIVDALEQVHTLIDATRVKYNVPRGEGKTFKGIGELIFNTKGLYTKLKEFEAATHSKFSLLNMENKETPEGVIYYHAMLYFGDEIFNPLSTSDQEIRKRKEERLQVRLQLLSEIIKPEQTLEEKQSRALQTLDDLCADNWKIIKGDPSYIAVPGASFMGFQANVPSEWVGPGLGRFEKQFTQAERTVKDMTSGASKLSLASIKQGLLFVNPAPQAKPRAPLGAVSASSPPKQKVFLGSDEEHSDQEEEVHSEEESPTNSLS